MEITEVRIKLMSDTHDRLKAFCSITLDGAFVVRDLKIIQGGKGPFVAMPSRKLTDKCPKCSSKNNLRAAFCNDCGYRLRPDRAMKDHEGRAKLYADVAHPINSECRDLIQEDVLRAYEEELLLARQPGYICRYDDYGEDDFAPSGEEDWDRDVQQPAPSLASSPAASTTQVQSHAGEPLRGPHSSPSHEGPRREVAGVTARHDDDDADSFGEGII